MKIFFVFSIIILLWINLVGNEARSASEKFISSSDAFSDPGDEFSSPPLQFSTADDEPTVVPGNCAESTRQTETWFTAKDSLSPDRSRAMVLNFLTECTRAERRKIRNSYGSKYGDDMGKVIKELIKNWSPNDKTIMITQMRGTLPKYLAAYFHQATNLTRPNYDAVRLILTPLSDESEIKEILDINQHKYGVDLRKDLLHKSRRNPRFYSILEHQLKGRAIDVETDAETNDNAVRSAGRDAENIVKLMDLDDSEVTDDADFHMILLTSSYNYLQSVFDKYKNGRENLPPIMHDLYAANVAKAYTDIIRYATDKDVYFAEKLDVALMRDRVDTNTLIFILSWRAEIDLGNIKAAYEQLYDVSLYEVVKNAIKEDEFLRDVLLGIIGNP